MRSVVTIGVFDGVHIGHRRVIRGLVSRGRKAGLRSVVVTFDPHPLKILRPKANVPSLISLAHRIRLIKSLGVDKVVVLNFTKKVAGLRPEDFVRSILVNRLGTKEIIVGENFYFGKGAGAGVKKLKALAKGFGIRVRSVRPVKSGGRVISSSAIRKLVTRGELSKAARLLGRPVSILGTVVAGARFARVLGYPTANINPHHEAIPPFGVYAARVNSGGKLYKGVLNIGARPTFYSPRDEEPQIEAHIFGFNKNIYGREIEVLFVKKIRDERKFTDRESLIHQIRLDSSIARKLV